MRYQTGKCIGLLVVALVGLAMVPVAQATMVLDLVALPGPGYEVTDEGKHVTITNPAAGPAAIQMALVANFLGYQPGADTGLFSTQGVIVSDQGQGGALMHGVLTSTNTSAFSVLPGSHGKVQDLNGDGMGDVGRTGAATGTPPVWVSSGGATTDWLRPNQTATPPGSPPGAPGTQVLANVLLEGIQINPTVNPQATTEYNYIPRSGGGNHTWRENGVGVNGIPVVGRGVDVAVIPEPSTIVLMVMCGLGLAVGYLRRKG